MIYNILLIKMSIPKLRQRLRRARHHQTGLLEELLAIPALLRGSFTRVFTRCGKPNCWCARSDQGHAHARMSWSEHGRLITRKVPAPQVDQIRALTANYRRFRRLRRALVAADGQLSEWLDQYEQQQIATWQRRLALRVTAQKNTGRTYASAEKRGSKRTDQTTQ